MKKYTLFLFFALLAGIISCSGPKTQNQSAAPAGRYYVKTDGNDEASGASWKTAFATLQKALEEAKPGYEIWVAAGTYTPTRNAADGSTGDGGSDNTFVLRDSVAIYGGFPNTGNPGMADRNWEANPTILSGDLGNDKKTYHVVIAVNASDKTLLDGFTITGGDAHVYGGEEQVIVFNGDNVPRIAGGGIYINNSSLVLTNLIIMDNSAQFGGGMCNDKKSAPVLTNVIIKENRASQGGGMYNSSSSPILTDVTISENVTDDCGGGMANEESSPVLTRVVIRKNSVLFRGGGIYNTESSPVLNNVTISENIAPDGGGGMENFKSKPVLTNVIISGNSADDGGGGGINNNDSSPVLINVLISGNVAYSGGGMANTSSYPDLTNVTIAGNSAGDGKSGAICNHSSYLSFYNTIISENSSGMVDDDSHHSYYHSMVQGMTTSQMNTSGLGNLGAGSVFMAPVNPAAAPTTEGDYRLLKNSHVLGKGSARYNETTTDLDGKERFMGNIDLGPYELYRDPVRYHVKTSGSDAADGKSWENAFQSLQKGIESAQTGDAIWVAAGTYKPTRNADDGTSGDGGRDNAFVLNDRVTIYGGFPGTGNPTMSDRNWETHSTILSGDIGVVGNPGDNCCHVVISVEATEKALLDGFIITGGNASIEDEGAEGEDFDVYGRITVNGQLISGCRGGGMYNRSSSPTLNNIIFRDNKATFCGGGIYCTWASSPTLNHVSIIGNSADSWGGGMSNNRGASPVLNHVVISENQGDGICNRDSSPILTHVTISKNIGSGMENFSSCPLLTEVTISENVSTSEAGGIYNNESHPLLVNVIISGNKGVSGGGIENVASHPILVNVVISGNVSEGKGGGIYNYYEDSPVLINVTISGNTAREGGGIVFAINDSTVLYNTIVFGNSSGIVQQNNNHLVSFYHSLVQGMSAEELNTSGMGNLDANDITGAVFTAPLNPSSTPATGGDYRLAKGSAVIDKGNPDCWNVARAYFPIPLKYQHWEYPNDNLTYKAISVLNEKSLTDILTSNGIAITDLDGKKRVSGVIDLGAYENEK